MIESEKQGIRYLQFRLLSGYPDLFHGVFCRYGGVSTGVFKSLNIGLSVGDTAANVVENRRRISRCLQDVPLVFSRQVHGAQVLEIAHTEGVGRWSGTGAPPEADAMVSAMRQMGLGIQTADCQAVMIYDPVGRVVANVHSGWRGSAANVIGRTVAKMREQFGSRPADMVAGIGPSLGPCCAEFVNFDKEIPEGLWAYKDNNDYFDFWAISTDQLTAAGLEAHRIETAGLCTRCRTDMFFSYRGEGKTGRFAAVIGVGGAQPPASTDIEAIP